MDSFLNILFFIPRSLLDLFVLLQPTTFEQATALLSVLGGVAAAIAALVQYRAGQRWKAIEFVVPEMRAFFEKPGTKAVCKMIDWSDSAGIAIGDGNRLDFTRADVKRSLTVHRFDFDEKQETIRDLFDDFFTYLENLNSYVDRSNRLFSPNVIRPYFRYYLKIVNDPSNGGFGRALREFVAYYEYCGVISLTETILGEKWLGPWPITDEDIEPPMSVRPKFRG